ncbi:MAG: DUF4159 domain-containing protein [Armatimonadota bacterium]
MLNLMLATSPMDIFKTALFSLLFLGMLAFFFYALYRGNRLLFWCLSGALTAHLACGGILWGAGKLMEKMEDIGEIRVSITGIRKPVPPKDLPKPPVDKPDLPTNFALPAGRMDGNRKVTKMPKGDNLKARKSGGNPGRPMVSGISDAGEIPVDPDNDMLLNGSLKEAIDASDIRNLSNFAGSGGGRAGTPDGEGDGDVPAGFANGKVGGRAYFVRLKHGSGAWNAFNDGTQRLLQFLNTYFPCEGDTRAMTATEMRDRYMSKGVQPTFLYLYCDDSFSLSPSEVTVLREYMSKGGFLFLDSLADPFVKEKVVREIKKVLPASSLSRIAKSHPINSFLFALSEPGLGENFSGDRSNYGVTQGGRLVAFYTMGNMSHVYAVNSPQSDQYFTAQYQMGANVMVYAITKGSSDGITKRKGASAVITPQALEKLGLLDSPAPLENKKPGESVKVKKDPPPGGETPGGEDNSMPDEPDEIIIQ